MQNKYYMKDEVPFQDYAVYTEKSGGGRGKGVAIFLVILLLIIATAGGLYFLGQNAKSGSSVAISPTQSPTVPPEPSATPTPVLERKDITVSVLNGSGVAGAANSTASTLRELGYIVGATGNADKFNYTGITVQVSSDKKDYVDLLKSDLEDDAQSGTVTATVSADLKTDAVVIVGK